MVEAKLRHSPPPAPIHHHVEIRLRRVFEASRYSFRTMAARTLLANVPAADMQITVNPRLTSTFVDPGRSHVVSSQAGLHALRAEWDELLNADPDATIFQSWDWTSTWFEHFAAPHTLRVLA